MRVLVAGAGLAVPSCALLLGLTLISGSSPSAGASAGSSVCATTGPLPGLSLEASANARLIVAAAETLGNARAAVIAVMTGYTESGLRILGNPAVDTTGLAIQGSG